jgi:hypothetical protein
VFQVQAGDEPPVAAEDRVGHFPLALLEGEHLLLDRPANDSPV